MLNLLNLFAADLEQQITQLGIKTVLVSMVILLVTTSVAALLKNRFEAAKLPLFVIMAATLVVSTAILLGSTVYLNNKAESRGPVHWHSDIEYWACGVELELRDPSGALSNKIGSATYHEHNDKRIHLEGVVVRKAEDASLGKFMRLVDGYITDTSVAIPLNENYSDWFAQGDQTDGDYQRTERFAQLKNFVKHGDKGPYMELRNGQDCYGQRAELQTFVYEFEAQSKTYRQRRLDQPANYVMRDEALVPPGDCVIVEFDIPKARTDKLCRQYGVRDSRRCVSFGVMAYSPELCDIKEVAGNGGDD